MCYDNVPYKFTFYLLYFGDRRTFGGINGLTWSDRLVKQKPKVVIVIRYTHQDSDGATLSFQRCQRVLEGSWSSRCDNRLGQHRRQRLTLDLTVIQQNTSQSNPLSLGTCQMTKISPVGD